MLPFHLTAFLHLPVMPVPFSPITVIQRRMIVLGFLHMLSWKCQRIYSFYVWEVTDSVIKWQQLLMINKGIPALLFQASLNDRSMGLVTEVSEGRVWGRSLVMGFQYFQGIPAKYGSSVIWSKLIELLLCLLPAFSSYIPWDEGDGDQKEGFPFPHHKVK